MWIVDALYVIVAMALGSALLWNPGALAALLLLSPIAAAMQHHKLVTIPQKVLCGGISALLIAWLFASTAATRLIDDGAYEIIDHPGNVRYPALLIAITVCVLWVVWGKRIRPSLFIAALPSLFSPVVIYQHLRAGTAARSHSNWLVVAGELALFGKPRQGEAAPSVDDCRAAHPCGWSMESH